MKAIAHRASFKRNFFIPAECVAAWFINTLWAITLLSNLNSYLISGTKNLTSSVLPVKMCLKAGCLSRRVEPDSWATSTGNGTRRWPFPPSSSVDLCTLSSLRLMLFEWPACWLQEIFDVLDVFWLTNVKETTCHPVPRWCRCYVERKPDRIAGSSWSFILSFLVQLLRKLANSFDLYLGFAHHVWNVYVALYHILDIRYFHYH